LDYHNSSVTVHRTHTFCYFLFDATSTTENYTLSLHDALPIFKTNVSEENHSRRPHHPAPAKMTGSGRRRHEGMPVGLVDVGHAEDRKSTRLNSSHLGISYAVFCLKKKNK